MSTLIAAIVTIIIIIILIKFDYRII